MTEDTTGEPDEPAGDDPAEPAPAPAQPAKPARRRSRILTDDELDEQSYMAEHERAVARLHIAAKTVHGGGGDAIFLGGLIQQTGRLLRKTAEKFQLDGGNIIQNPELSLVAFGNSVDLIFERGYNEAPQLNTEGVEVTPTAQAADALAELMASPTEDLLEHALRLGPDVAVAYKGFLKELVEEDAIAEWQTTSTNTVISITSAEAQHDYAILDSLGERTHETVTVVGRLSGADSDAHQFKLILPKARPAILKNRHKVSGSMSDAIEQKVKAEGLWDSSVTATIRVEFDVPNTSATKREAKYELLEVEKADVELF